MTASALIVFAIIVVGCVFFSDEIDVGRCDISCRCGRRTMRNVVVSSVAQRCALQTQLSAICPWCCLDDAASKLAGPPGKGVDLHA